jgi:serine phosphatase RsbU (regulator of sigma subunit)/pSer/pThr/pTyr-binding forkhead associated (FHA) protein
MDPQPLQFTVYQPNLAPQHLAVQSETITLGRSSDCTIPIRDRFLSRRHAEITYDMSGAWTVRDCGSVNGTMLNGVKLTTPTVLRPGDRIGLGDSEVVFHATDAPSQLIAIDSTSHAKNLAIPMQEALSDQERTNVLASLAVEFIEDHPASELFDFILDRVMDVMKPTRCALALLGRDGKSFDNVLMRRQDSGESTDLTISKTLLGEVVEQHNVIAFVDTGLDEKLAKAESIVMQQIRSAVCAPLMVGDAVLGVLYLDFLATHGKVTHDDVRLIAQIARFAAAKLENTRLRDEAMLKAKLDEELRTAYTIQSRLLPAELPSVDGYALAGTNRPCKTVSGDYYDVVMRDDGKIFFVVADVSGKGITAALVMSSLATAFNIFMRTQPTPADLVSEINKTLAPKTAPTKFATLVAAVLDPATGIVEFTNAGHVAPLVVKKDGVTALTSTDMVVGLFAHAKYRTQSVTLEPGDSFVLFTDGITEAENEQEDQLGLTPVQYKLETLHGASAPQILETIEKCVQEFIGETPAGDDVTMLAVTRML